MMLPKLVDGFHADSSVLFFAYGQTGSGKTHTILGEISSLSSAEPVSCWGIFSASGEKHLEIDEAVARRGQEGHPAGVRRGISLLWVVRSCTTAVRTTCTRRPRSPSWTWRALSASPRQVRSAQVGTRDGMRPT
mmetsp:Transcript_12494/g.31553  ORF Transcript_12494/g.31553 Transcript_12494/m.31553 type:complete len:134 (-) Transcript_12494:55-456(-)